MFDLGSRFLSILESRCKVERLFSSIGNNNVHEFSGGFTEASVDFENIKMHVTANILKKHIDLGIPG